MKNWNYFLEAPNGDVLKEIQDVPFYEAPSGEETVIIDDKELTGHWHPMEK